MAKLIGTAPNQVPTNADLGSMAYQDYDVVAPRFLAGGNRNLIINGAMQVAQRGTSFTPASDEAVYTLDRFQFYQDAGTVGVDQVTDSPDGFEYSLKCEVDVTGSVSSTTILLIGQPIEGYNLAALDWNGGSNAKPATASFWVKSSEAGVYGFRIRLGGVGTFIKEFTINSSNTWEYKTVSIPACPYTIPNKTNGTGIFVGIQLVSGSNFHVASDGVWQTADAYGTSGMDNDWIATSGATFYFTGFQLEVGDTATPFEHRSFGQELALCQRYYETDDAEGSDDTRISMNKGTTASSYYWSYPYKVTKRALPTVTINQTYDNDLTLQYSGGSATKSHMGLSNTTGGSTNTRALAEFNWIADAEL